ncbi:unnamed protein product [marine sediment metagenome]|uniref:AP2/ERF domain-containing protein n=1 Tax=marine sediment metagenome TaxID=412755 RepID=X1HE96_9ZZZZ
MSADNAIFIKQADWGTGYWHVWMGFLSSDNCREIPEEAEAAFKTEAEAAKFAFDWMNEEAIVEYGVIRLDD